MGFEPTVKFPLHTLPSVFRQPLGHLSALESTSCERSERVYRTRLRIPRLFVDAVWILRFAVFGGLIASEIVSDLLMCREHLRGLASAPFVFPLENIMIEQDPLLVSCDGNVALDR